MTTILTTKDYKQFKTVKGNRGTSKSHIKKLKEAIQAKPSIIEFNPILVNEKMEIIDGQHRKEAISELGLPIHYLKVKGLTLDDVQALNSGKKNWSPLDFAKAYAVNGNQNYSTYLVHRDKFGFNHDVTVQYCGFPNANTGASFTAGNFQAGKDQELVFKYSQQLVDISKFVDHAFYRTTAFALLSMFQNPDYDHKHMLKRLEAQGHLVQRYPRKEEAIRELAAYYNKHKKSGGGYVLFNLD